MSQRKHWAVLVFVHHLDRTDARFHEWYAPGVTACNRVWRVADFNLDSREPPAVWVHRKNAEKFAQPCKVCEQVMASVRAAA
jgi:hypothetical protein